MTQALFRDDAYRAEAEAMVMSSEPRGVALDCTIFYAQGGGQSGDRATLMLEDGAAVPIVNTIYDSDRATILHVPAEGAALPRPGARVIARIDWDLRYQRMRAHTALHLLSVVLPYPVTGGSVGDAEGRLDFDSGEAALDKANVERRLNELIALNAAVSQRWIADEELMANPGLIKTVGEAADGIGPRPPRRDRRPGPAALRRHACRAHRRNRPRIGDRNREEGQDQSPRAHRARQRLISTGLRWLRETSAPRPNSPPTSATPTSA